MELVQVKGNTWCLKGREMIPLYKVDDRRCILLDSGQIWDRRALCEALDAAGLNPVGVIASHGHVDHVGANALLKEKYGTKLCMTANEAVLTSSIFMFKEMYYGISLDAAQKMMGKLFFQTDQIMRSDDGVEEFMGVPFRIHHTPGHSIEHVCIGTPDGVCYVGDLLLSREVLEHAQLPYHFIHTMARESMEKMRRAEGYSTYIMAHRGVTEDFGQAVDQNLARLDWICGHILNLMDDPKTMEQLIMETVKRNNLCSDNENKALTYMYTLQTFLDYLKDTGRVTVEVERGVQRYKKC